MKSLLKSFTWASRGIAFCFKHERNFRIHCVLAVYVFAFAPSFFTTTIEWAILFITVFLMLSTEAINTALENLTDIICPEKNKVARVVKDVAAGAVLLCTICSVLVGILLFWKPKIWYNLFMHWKDNVYIPILLAISIIFSFFIIFSIKQQKENTD